jgi:hypothetical protein
MSNTCIVRNIILPYNNYFLNKSRFIYKNKRCFLREIITEEQIIFHNLNFKFTFLNMTIVILRYFVLM